MKKAEPHLSNELAPPLSGSDNRNSSNIRFDSNNLGLGLGFRVVIIVIVEIFCIHRNNNL